MSAETDVLNALGDDIREVRIKFLMAPPGSELRQSLQRKHASMSNDYNQLLKNGISPLVTVTEEDLIQVREIGEEIAAAIEQAQLFAAIAKLVGFIARLL